jgi:hypothetical protein
MTTKPTKPTKKLSKRQKDQQRWRDELAQMKAERKAAKALLIDPQTTTETPTKTAPDTERPTVGRPKTGKRSNPDYQQVSAWIRRDTYRRAMDRLYVKEDRREFSDLVQVLLEDWLKTSSKKSEN